MLSGVGLFFLLSVLYGLMLLKSVIKPDKTNVLMIMLYSDDMTAQVGQRLGKRFEGQLWPELPLMEGEAVLEAPVERNDLTRRCTEAAVDFIESHQEEPFFLYFAQPMPGSTSQPFSSPEFGGRSKNGAWGDAIEEIDWSTGVILDKLVELGIHERTLVIWTSDNGAPLAKDPSQLSRGSNQPLSGRGYSTAEGGFRVPTLMWWPGHVTQGETCEELATTLDLLPTFVHLAGGKLETHLPIDGMNIHELVTGPAGAKSPREVFYFYEGAQLQAVRRGAWKLFVPLKTFERHPHFTQGQDNPPVLFHLYEDPSSRIDRAQGHPKIVEQLLQDAEVARKELGDLDRPGVGQRQRGFVGQVQSVE